jgi:hypothetical protein
MSAPGRHGRENLGDWPEPSRAPTIRDIESGNQLIPQVTPAATPSGPGIGILSRTFSRCEERILTIGITAGNAQLGSQFPAVIFNGPAFASTSCGIVNSAGAPIGLGAGHPYLACVLEYGSGSASQKCWFDWYQGSYNVPACEYVRVSALPWGTWWGVFPGPVFNAVAAVAPGKALGAHVPTVTAVGSFAAGVAQTVSTPANARAVEVTAVDPTVNTTVTLSGAAAGTRNLSTGVIVPGWSPLELDLGIAAVVITSSAAATLRVQFYCQL